MFMAIVNKKKDYYETVNDGFLTDIMHPVPAKLMSFTHWFSQLQVT